jgi:hypothetical protein
VHFSSLEIERMSSQLTMEQIDTGMQLARGNYLDQSAPLHDSFALVISLYGDYYHSLAHAGYNRGCCFC